MEYRFESDSRSESVLYTIMGVAGLWMTYAFSDMLTVPLVISPDDNTLPGFILGVLLVCASCVGFIMRARRIIIIHQRDRVIDIVQHTFGRTKRMRIAFDDIVHIRLSQFGITTGERRYDVVLILRNGTEVGLFSLAYFRGSFERACVEERKRLVEDMVFGPRKIPA